MQSLSLQLSYHTFKGTQRAFVLFLLLVGVLPGLPTCMSYSALPLLCDVAWASSSKFNAKVKQSDYVLGSIKVVVLILLFFFLCSGRCSQMDTQSHNTQPKMFGDIQ